jgi:hypothetical protein
MIKAQVSRSFVIPFHQKKTQQTPVPQLVTTLAARYPATANASFTVKGDAQCSTPQGDGVMGDG